MGFNKNREQGNEVYCICTPPEVVVGNPYCLRCHEKIRQNSPANPDAFLIMGENTKPIPIDFQPITLKKEDYIIPFASDEGIKISKELFEGIGPTYIGGIDPAFGSDISGFILGRVKDGKIEILTPVIPPTADFNSLVEQIRPYFIKP